MERVSNIGAKPKKAFSKSPLGTTGERGADKSAVLGPTLEPGSTQIQQDYEEGFLRIPNTLLFSLGPGTMERWSRFNVIFGRLQPILTLNRPQYCTHG